MKFLLVCVLGLLLAAPCLAQDDDVVRVKSNLVNIDVIVKDKKGKYVQDLKAEDFTIFENGVPQKLEFFDAPLAGDKRGNTKTPAAGAPGDTTGPSSAPRNYVALVLDSQTTDITNLKQVREGMLKYAREQLTDSDVVALLSVTTSLNLIHQFTTDKNQLIAALEKLGAGNTSKNVEQKDLAENINALRQELIDNAAIPTTQISNTAGGSQAARQMIMRTMLAQFLKLRTALSIQQSRPILAALAAICEGLRPIPGKKTLVLFSQGFVTPAILDWQVQSTIDLANRANVAIYIVDSAGLRANAPASGALVPGSPLAGISGATNQEDRIRAVGGETVFDNSRQEGLTREYDILYRLSGDTGGRFLKGSNDIGQGLERINDEIQARYTLAYRSTNQNFDSSFRKVKIEVRRPDAQIISRAGYYAIPPEEITLLSPADKKLFDNFASVQASSGFPVSVSLSAFRWRDGLYTVPLAIELPPDAVQFDRKGDKRSMRLEVLGVLKATPDKLLTRLGGNFDVNLSASDYNSIVSNNIFYRQDLQLTPGDYTIDLIVRDRQSGKIGAKREQVVLPDLDAEFAATNLVLSRYVAAVTPQLTDSRDVFTYRNTAIRPSAARQFRASDNLVMYLAIYNAADSADTGKPMVRVTARLMKDGQPATKPFDFVLTEIDNKPVPHLTFAEYIRLTGMAPGNYTVTIEAKDMVNKKLIKQEAPFAIVP
ncbi:MAG TPA: VWA domain-containing protein [Pyrinomonadaceae bacterium]|nr:VWA domain-containing protein [Pyrinomonadaceae bacterium]